MDNSYFGKYGGTFIPETLSFALEELLWLIWIALKLKLLSFLINVAILSNNIESMPPLIAKRKLVLFT